MIVLDIGACVGIFTDYCIEKYGIDKIEKIYAFEPFKANYDFLVEKYTDNDKVQIFNYAISDFVGEARLYKKPKKNTMPFVWDYVGAAGSSLNKRKVNVWANSFDIVKVEKISSFFIRNSIMSKEELNKIKLIKIDVEGAEYKILEDIIDSGMYKSLSQIYFEDHCHKVSGLKKERDRVLQMIEDLDIKHMFYIQAPSHPLDYIPLP
tara:strand:+ start:3570 stop:4190 length:621 start_codon:yes stop_codon:yes gene_type:complete